MAPDVAAEHLWKKSSYSGQTGTSCVEVADLTSQVGIRDSKDKTGPALVVSAAAWTSFVGMVCPGAVDFGMVGHYTMG